MIKYLTIINSWFKRRMFFVVVSAVLLGLILPMNTGNNTKMLSIVFFAYMTFVTSLETSFKKVVSAFKNPWPSMLAVLLTHIGSPLIAWFIGYIFYINDPMIRFGLLIVAAVPMGVTSIIWTGIAGGDVAVSIMAVTLDTIIAPVLLPGFFMAVAGKFIHIDYFQMVIQLLWMVTIPSIVGMLLKDATKGRLDYFPQSIGGVTSKASIFFMIYLNASLVAPLLELSLPMLKMLLVVFIMLASNFFLGYIGSYLFKKRKQELMPAMIYSVGMRNNAFGMVLALSYFTPAMAIPITLSVLFQQPISALIAQVLSCKKTEEF
ncbi:MAG TPA: bile acid:sodium symporter family protein [Bacillota bacterium]|nr:bile acid:sodium symporter family protein [Bacillota bacterium]